ncbi:UxaA family hydrolase [Sporomusa acidovorans]|uniref:(2R)-sulfolactate sulfo-lyase subunit beta n=1 Tax=Sporomusa acidovorans (strain ATCC 49682 / DSM 3132 / Mol) TaxID=1123286 RepID=A0ABZ3J5L9_SPOA4|nr:UxaA family hydrolase [Sporomusa acidovorans]OZC24296.1 (2R)-sulfolactate sulfo-lyase subunit beta [Sporomusa acidovorans DSM 3132]SDF02716.1 (2R)-sulfolactate sulfo-lyase subunit beta [Sporomusa acidovorans]
MNTKILGYRRENGRIGIRNHVLILPLDAVSYTVCRAVSHTIAGTVSIYHPYGRMQFGADLDLHFRTLIGTGSNPNVAAVIVVGIEPNWTNKVADGIAKTGKPVAAFWTDGNGDFKTIEMACRKAKEFVQYATALEKVEADLSDLVIGYKCGESDTTSGLAANPAAGVACDRLIKIGATVMFGETPEITGAEHILVKHFATPELGEKFLAVFKNYLDLIFSKGEDLLGSQPNQGNIAGGISTIEEKALGNIQKLGKSPIVGVLDTCEEPKQKGLHFMNTSSAAADLVTAMAAAGAVMTVFTTGKGNNVGNPITPVLKLCANPKACHLAGENIDVNLSGIMSREITLEQAGDRIIDAIVRASRGQYTATEVLKHDEFALTRLFPQS